MTLVKPTTVVVGIQIQTWTTYLSWFVCYSCKNLPIYMNSNGIDTWDILHPISFVFKGFGCHGVVHSEAEISIGPNLGLSQIVITQFYYIFSINSSHVFWEFKRHVFSRESSCVECVKVCSCDVMWKMIHRAIHPWLYHAFFGTSCKNSWE
jgi:hypothetical protein